MATQVFFYKVLFKINIFLGSHHSRLEYVSSVKIKCVYFLIYCQPFSKTCNTILD